jgi:magnesium-transporting ATPase (P-type)
MGKTNKWLSILSLMLTLGAFGYFLFQWLVLKRIDASVIFVMFIFLSFSLNLINWGHQDGPTDKDELVEHVQAQSAKIGYYALAVLSVLILFISEKTGDLNEITNIPLLLVVGLTFVTAPIVEFFYKKKFM